MRVTTFTDVFAKEQKVHDLEWAEIVRRLESPKQYEQKKDAPLLKLGVFGNRRTDKDSLRSDENLEEITGIEGDYDGEQVTPEKAVSRLERHGIRALVYTSPSHTDEKPRWRILAPLSASLPKDRRPMLVGRLNGALGGILASESFTASQTFYYGRINGHPYRCLATFGDPQDGTCINELDELDAIAIGQPELGAAGDDPTGGNPPGLIAAERERLRSALPFLGDAEDRPAWMRIGMALHEESHGGEDGFGLWCEWARQPQKKFDLADSRRVWRSFGSNQGQKITVASLLHQARGNGWREPAEKAPANIEPNGPHPVVIEWPEPEPLPSGLAAVQPFDPALLPDSLRPWVSDVSERLQCPADFVAVPLMVALGSLIGRKVAIRPQVRTDWSAYPNVWGCIIGRPGTMKSPAVSEALRPLRQLDAKARADYDAEMAVYKTEVELGKLRQDAAKAAARKKLLSRKGAEICADDIAVELPEEPTLRRYTANDTSLEALGELLQQNPNGLLIERDELASLLAHLSQEEHAGARGFYLTGADAREGYTFDRIGRGLNLRVPAVCLSIIGTTQPGKIGAYLRQALSGGEGDDGLMQRFGLMVWPNHGGEWRNVDRWPDTEAKRQAFATFERLAHLEPAGIGAEHEEGFVSFVGAEGGKYFLRFSPEAAECFIEWRANLEARLRSAELHPALESHLAKYRKTIPALALILHVSDGGVGSVALAPTLRALAWSEYLESHARRCYGATL